MTYTESRVCSLGHAHDNGVNVAYIVNNTCDFRHTNSVLIMVLMWPI